MGIKINREAPMSLMNIKPGQEVEVKLVNKMEEQYQETKKPVQSFAGQGNRLGSISSTPVNVPASTTATNQQPSMSIDNTLPTTQIQFRLADGTRLVSRFNHHHSVNDLYGFVRMFNY